MATSWRSPSSPRRWTGSPAVASHWGSASADGRRTSPPRGRAIAAEGDGSTSREINVAVGPDSVVDEAVQNIRSYYGFMDRPEEIVDRLITTPARIRDTITAFEDLGVDEVMLYCWSGDPNQVDRIAESVL